MRLALALLFGLSHPAAAQVNATPDTEPARFMELQQIGRSGPDVMAYARAVLDSEIGRAEAAMGRQIEVTPLMVGFSDGRQMLYVTLCDGIYFGNSGCASHFLLAAPGATQVTPVLDMIGATTVWFDTQLGVDGWPDLIFAGNRIGYPPHIRWRWTGATFEKIWP